ncbi:HNH endonuclease signature motif containing protein [Ornithinimicrobium cryptoxanthini]|uniref:HNH endonuclease signature motif containing protein n=1 Tax=Ornithinimicrobium cryptoxanthini TaxID=2934161 RepID=UPI0021195E20|nr:HNH endonuclease signature motif containing protein [Ornithinimicrobium cryptoxanthini]
MDQGSRSDSRGGATVAAPDVPTQDNTAQDDTAQDGRARDGADVGGRGPMKYRPVIGTGPLREASSCSGPLVPPDDADPQAAGDLDGSGRADGGPRLTASGHEVPEFAAGTAHMTQLLAGDFPLETLPEEALGETVGAAQALVQAAQSLLTAATHEAISRGLPGESGHSVPDWITTWAPMIDRPEALATARVAAAIDDDRFEALSAKVTDGSARVSRANIITRLTQELTPVATKESLQALTDVMTDIVETTGLRALAQIGTEAKKLLIEPDDDDELDDKQGARRLLRRTGTVAGLAEWQLLLDDEAEAILLAALDPLSKPRPGADEHGAHQLDPRTASTRRADALLEIIGRGVAAPEGTVVTDKAKIQVTIGHEALAGKVSGGGTTATGQRLSAGTIRRLACDAQIIPIVLGGPSEPLDVGTTRRLFTPAQRKAVHLRDKGCSFPGCTMPASWTDLHHVIHWIFGGATDLSNAAALCRRHHVTVHRYGYTATITATEVIWHLPGTSTGTHAAPLVDT